MIRESQPVRDEDVVLGDDWLTPKSPAEVEAAKRRRRNRGWITFYSSPLARKIITFNLVGLIVLVAGVLFLNPFQDSLAYQFETRLVSQASLIGQMLERQGPPGPATAKVLAGLRLDNGARVVVFDKAGLLLADHTVKLDASIPQIGPVEPSGATPFITSFLNWVWRGLSTVFSLGGGIGGGEMLDVSQISLTVMSEGEAYYRTARTPDDESVFAVGIPLNGPSGVMGSVVMISAAGQMDRLIANEREQVLQMFIIAILVSIGLSMVLSSTIANPLGDLATAAEAGSENPGRRISPERVRIPDLTGRPDEIGRLSAAIRKMVTALYDRIEANEQFAADVAHEIKNPLASLRSAVGTMHVAKRDDQRTKLLDVIEHDVRRLDRLVSDISNASRLDSELVKEEERPFDLLKMVEQINQFLGEQAREKGIDYIADMPPDPIVVSGLKERLAQVFVNIITNAISFCADGDAIRLWVRKRDNRVLVVVEDTGPGIPDQALVKIFNRFYSQRPEGQFGNNSGLGLAISKQIVEAHGGVIWAENIRQPDAEEGSPPLGARFVVGLPV
jgi:two-component system, OmpR family, sensor histidine kinase ChvG